MLPDHTMVVDRPVSRLKVSSLTVEAPVAAVSKKTAAGKKGSSAESLQLSESTDSSAVSNSVNKRAVSAKTAQQRKAEQKALEEAEEEEEDFEDDDSDDDDDDDQEESGSNPWLAGAKARQIEHHKKGKGKVKLGKEAEEEGEDLDIEALLSGLDRQGEEGEEGTNFSLLGLSDEQKEIVKRAFATGVEEEDFDEEKAEVMAEDEPKPEPVLPGWGSWAGEGVKAPNPKKVQQQKAKKDKNGVPVEPRKDANLKNVIINEKRDKKAAKYMLDQLPHPFTSREQYEQAMRHPLGREWNTTAVYHRLIQPDVVAKKGAVIKPLQLQKHLPPRQADSLLLAAKNKIKPKRPAAKF
eukprot:GILI01008241.1.p1 GENE.GILI01008241.1~~GILI01008241.1.p1  ORF type:complete len:352 (-),score=162.59 GILI01008241.1:266-1321(-)